MRIADRKRLSNEGTASAEPFLGVETDSAGGGYSEAGQVSFCSDRGCERGPCGGTFLLPYRTWFQQWQPGGNLESAPDGEVAKPETPAPVQATYTYYDLQGNGPQQPSFN